MSDKFLPVESQRCSRTITVTFMRLLNTSSLKLHEYNRHDVPDYAILSHVWAHKEVLFDEMASIETLDDSYGLRKLKDSCMIARELGHEYVWVDTACIDKRSSAELTEAINSMYSWYREAETCIVFLSDVNRRDPIYRTTPEALAEQFRNSRWFTRGWTLQELIACKRRRFFDCRWEEIVDGDLTMPLLQLCSQVTGIHEDVLKDPIIHIRNTCIATRMSWAANRETTRPEDRAYSLMGIFDVNMPILYGEGDTKAFYRLQNEIMKTSYDQTLFAWRGHYKSSGLLALSPSDFAHTPFLSMWTPTMLSPHYMTNIGIAIRPCLYTGPTDLPADVMKAALQCDVKTPSGWMILAIRLKRVHDAHCYINGEPQTAWRRIDCDTWDLIPSAKLVDTSSLYEDAIVLEDEHEVLLEMTLSHGKRKRTEKYGTEEASMSIPALSLPPSTSS